LRLRGLLSQLLTRSELGPVALIQPVNNHKEQPLWWTITSEGYLKSIARVGRRPNTIRAYAFELKDFGRWLGRAQVGALSDLSRQHVEDWQDEIQQRKAPRTRQVAATAVRGVLRWAADHDMALSSPSLWLRVVQPRAPHLEPRPIPMRQLDLILSHLEPTPTDLGQLRTRALFLVILSSGARISEALSLTRAAVDEDTVLVTQKGGSLHRLMMGGKARAAAIDYLDARRDHAQSLFISHDYRRPLSPLSKKEAQRGWDDLCAEVNAQRFTSHQIRHSCATELLRQGVNPLVIAKHLGHHGLGTIQGYAEVALDSRRQALKMMDGTYERATASTSNLA
jgi:integrase/recombinase XerD